ncbi:hypothetical protein [Candidatus Palauibacter sp.]|uniref:hypothetical protein n=1 Tax=Candidatus Palauibacter sp. TaxID=3101350 RepID=UPI003B517FEE
MSHLRLLPFAVSAAASIAKAFAVPVVSWATPRARWFRRIVAAGLAVAMLIPLVPCGRLHAETTDHEAGGAAPVEVAETDTGAKPVAAAVALRCAPYISSQSWMTPDTGHLTEEICATLTFSFGLLDIVSCRVCLCTYEMESGRRLVIGESDCGGSIVISTPGDDCEDDVC